MIKKHSLREDENRERDEQICTYWHGIDEQIQEGELKCDVHLGCDNNLQQA